MPMAIRKIRLFFYCRYYDLQQNGLFSLQPAETMKIDQEQNGCNGPRQRITKYYSLNSRMNWHCSTDPHDSEYTDSQAGKDHGDPAVAGST